MKNKVIAFLIICVLCLSTICYIGSTNIRSLRAEVTSLKGNQEALLFEHERIMAESQKYKIQDSLNAVTISSLELSLKTYKKLHADDTELIKASKAKQQDLEHIISAQTKAIQELSMPVNHTDSLIAFNYKSKWLDVNGQIYLYTDSLNLSVASRDSLIIIESVEHKRFLNFLWRTRKIKSRRVNVISKNPYSQIMGAESILINN